MNWKALRGLLAETYAQWSLHKAPRLGAAVAFYSLLSFAPLLIVVTAVIGLVFGQTEAHNDLIRQAQHFIGNRGAEAVESLLQSARRPVSGFFATIIAVLTVLFGASGVFAELQDALDTIWDVKPKNEPILKGFIRQRLFAFGMVIAIGFLLLVSLVLSAVLAFLGAHFSENMPLPAPVLEFLNSAFSIFMVTVLFGLIYKYVPAASVDWADVRIGALITALLFTGGKFLLGLYLGKASVGSTYGAAGSLVAVIVWVYYSAQIFFFGAEFTRVYANSRVGRQKQPAAPPSETATKAFKARA